jgi:hypothetical protein
MPDESDCTWAGPVAGWREHARHRSRFNVTGWASVVG